jgi:hypothetical protein
MNYKVSFSVFAVISLLDNILGHTNQVHALFLSILLRCYLPVYVFVSHVFLPLIFSTKFVCAFLVFPICATFPLHYTILHSISLIIFLKDFFQFILM